MSGHLVKNGPEYPHDCRAPGRWQRKRLGARFGAIWQCGVCGDRWSWEGSRHGTYWIRRPRKYGESE